MKKILFSLVALVCSMSMNAQIMKIMKNGQDTPVETYYGSDYYVVFEEAPAAPASASWTKLTDIDNWAPSAFGKSVIIVTEAAAKPAGATELNDEGTVWVRIEGDNCYIETVAKKIVATSMNATFAGCKITASSNLDKIDVSGVTSFEYCFTNCYNATAIDVSSWNISSTANTDYMFRSCNKLESLTLNNTFHASDNGSMFNYVGSQLTESNKCVVYGVTDEAVKTNLKGSSSVGSTADGLDGTGWYGEHTKIKFDGE